MGGRDATGASDIPFYLKKRRSPHSRANRWARLLWGAVYAMLFRPSPRPLYGWRRWLLRLFGARIASTASIYPKVRCWGPWNLTIGEYVGIADHVDLYCVAPIEIGSHTTISQYTYLCGATHDFERVERPVVAMPITVGRYCWLAADVFVGPGVTIGDGTVVGARSSVFHDLPGWKICVGTPARVLRDRKLGPADYAADETRTTGGAQLTSDAAVATPANPQDGGA